uniref:Uncharacterized protein n=1 Tax=Ditylenchus dipsaci TaxID=166011 RepID=A0A915CY14_9BILA
MLAARGVSLGLGKINLSELNVLPSDRAFLGKLRRKKKAEEAKHKIIIKKHVDKQTLWVACRMVVVGGVTIAVGLLMTVTVFFNTTLGTTMSIVDNSLRYKLKYAIYWSNPDGDKHAQIIQEESREQEKLQTPAYKENGQAMGKITTLISECHTNITQPPEAASTNLFAVKAEVHSQKCLPVKSPPSSEHADGLRTVYSIVHTRANTQGKAPIVRVESVLELSSMATPLSHSGSGSTKRPSW